MDIKLKKHFGLTKKSQHDLINEKPLFNKISTTVEKTITPTVVIETVPSCSSSRVRKKCDIRGSIFLLLTNFVINILNFLNTNLIFYLFLILILTIINKLHQFFYLYLTE